MTNDLSEIKSQVKALYDKKQTIHIDLSLKCKNKNHSDYVAEITGIYPNVFTIKTLENGIEKPYSFQYADLLIHNIEIAEIK